MSKEKRYWMIINSGDDISNLGKDIVTPKEFIKIKYDSDNKMFEYFTQSTKEKIVKTSLLDIITKETMLTFDDEKECDNYLLILNKEIKKYKLNLINK